MSMSFDWGHVVVVADGDEDRDNDAEDADDEEDDHDDDDDDDNDDEDDDGACTQTQTLCPDAAVSVLPFVGFRHASLGRYNKVAPNAEPKGRPPGSSYSSLCRSYLHHHPRPGGHESAALLGARDCIGLPATNARAAPRVSQRIVVNAIVV